MRSDRDMGAKHRARTSSIHILRVEVIPPNKCRRPQVKQFLVRFWKREREATHEYRMCVCVCRTRRSSSLCLIVCSSPITRRSSPPFVRPRLSENWRTCVLRMAPSVLAFCEWENYITATERMREFLKIVSIFPYSLC